MSGGHFDYNQFKIEDIAEEIQQELDLQGKEKSDHEQRMMGDFYEKYPEEKFNPTHPEKIQAEFKNAVKALKIAKVYAHRIDWYLSGDDGEDSFLRRLKEELEELDN